jgi:hypothetical protein
VEYMANAAYRAQLIPMRNYQVSTCFQPFYAGSPMCSNTSIVDYINLLRTNTQEFRTRHNELYLGVGSLQPFKDPRLLVSACRHQHPWRPYLQ